MQMHIACETIFVGMALVIHVSGSHFNAIGLGDFSSSAAGPDLRVVKFMPPDSCARQAQAPP
jgi:hypothetical protein